MIIDTSKNYTATMVTSKGTLESSSTRSARRRR